MLCAILWLVPLPLLNKAFKSIFPGICENRKFLHLGRNSPMHQYRLWNDQLERNFAEKALGSWWTKNLPRIHHHAFMAKADNSILDSLESHEQVKRDEVIFPLSLSSMILHPEWGIKFCASQYKNNTNIQEQDPYVRTA